MISSTLVLIDLKSHNKLLKFKTISNILVYGSLILILLLLNFDNHIANTISLIVIGCALIFLFLDAMLWVFIYQDKIGKLVFEKSGQISLLIENNDPLVLAKSDFEVRINEFKKKNFGSYIYFFKTEDALFIKKIKDRNKLEQLAECRTLELNEIDFEKLTTFDGYESTKKLSL